MRPHYLLIDGTNVVYRAYHACVARAGAEAVNPAHVVSLGTVMIQRLTDPLADSPPPIVLAVFDDGGDSGRRRLYHGYKANRPPRNLMIGQVTDALIGIFGRLSHRVYRHRDYEADDVIATLATQIIAAQPDTAIRVVTGDRDLLQLIGGGVIVSLIGRTIRDVRPVNDAAFRKFYGFGPELLPDYKAICGDPSDNIPGVRGIGQGIARHLVSMHGGIDAIYGNLAAVRSARVRQRLSDQEGDARTFLRLTTAIRDVPGVDFRTAGA